jgi:hypothetical protein
MPEEGITAVPAEPVNLGVSYTQQWLTRAYPVIYARLWSDAPTNSDYMMSWIRQERAASLPDAHLRKVPHCSSA